VGERVHRQAAIESASRATPRARELKFNLAVFTGMGIIKNQLTTRAIRSIRDKDGNNNPTILFEIETES
jgi:hypothetical protein